MHMELYMYMYTQWYDHSLVAKFLVPDWGDIVNSGIGMSHRPAYLYVYVCLQPGGTVRKPYKNLSE